MQFGRLQASREEAASDLKTTRSMKKEGHVCGIKVVDEDDDIIMISSDASLSE